MEKKYEVIAPFTLFTIYNHREFWPDGFDFVFEDLLSDVIDGVHDGSINTTDDFLKLGKWDEDDLDWLEKMGWIAEEKEEKYIKVKSGTRLRTSDDHEVYVYALICDKQYNLISINYGTRYFDDGVIGNRPEITLREINYLAEICTFSVVDK